MDTVKNAKENKFFCCDCKKEIKVEGKEIKNGKALVYEKEDGEKIMVLKCDDCFEKNKGLTNFQTCEVYSRIVGYLRPVQQWNLGKQREFQERREFEI